MPLTYEDAGVATTKNDKLVEIISANTGVSTGFSDAQPIHGTDNLFLVQCTDGVGTKIHYAEHWPRLYETIGQDLVAMCVNDLICSGAKPVFFQDYIGMNNLDEAVVETIIKSINDACARGGVKLTGGEMAEMPGSYAVNTPELVGFATGLATTTSVIKKELVREGCQIIGLPSSGPHSNGYSLIRKVFDNPPYSDTLMRDLLAPTEIYYEVAEIYHKEPWLITSMAHITGGGLENNLARAIPEGLKANIQWNNWQVPDIFVHIQNEGDVDPTSMWNTFNMGVGMCLISDQFYHENLIKLLSESGLKPFYIGEVIKA